MITRLSVCRFGIEENLQGAYSSYCGANGKVVACVIENLWFLSLPSIMYLTMILLSTNANATIAKSDPFEMNILINVIKITLYEVKTATTSLAWKITKR